ncbi:division/outer membrane stress-associated lipid-binding lipoprotein [Motilimonas sp. 1_MG-2023]|uniref:division/outer membrane stress-associated lipid-binding lipoprotein n=1 Tax=Motilimonas sp. 1_MG-2023 TaxID=3062672 RepID=UPI0026E3CA5B|nr:division/outer membrane stress-associated lipid-binding lipoprotein [Motilimonas sp. 1_MG-2023]MDO6524192.1 division/outer membrane stress-associated lipid-binding lipoprotein [Motilimonas sp. 1_MG-2023]
MKKRLSFALIASLSLVQGCAGLFVAGAATTAVVANDRRSVGTQLDDQNIELKAINALAKNELLYKASRISAIANNGNVLLVGQTPTAEYQKQAEKIVDDISGVRRVFNELRLNKPISLGQQTSDTWITTKTKSLILDDPAINTLKLKVVTEDAEVFLIGLVTEKEAEKAVEIARHVKGVKRVVKVFEYVAE